MSIHKYYKVSDEGIVRLNPFCPRCGPGFFMAVNYDRVTCGKCGYTEFKKKIPKKPKGEEKDKEAAKPAIRSEPPAKKKKKKTGKK